MIKSINFPVIKRSDFSIFETLESAPVLYRNSDFTLIYDLSISHYYIDKDLVSNIYYNGKKIISALINVNSRLEYGLEDFVKIKLEDGTEITNPSKIYLTYKSQIDLDFPDLVKIDTKGLSKDNWNPDNNYLYDFVNAYRLIKLPWSRSHTKCFTTLDRATHVEVINMIGKKVLILKKRLL